MVLFYLEMAENMDFNLILSETCKWNIEKLRKSSFNIECVSFGELLEEICERGSYDRAEPLEDVSYVDVSDVDWMSTLTDLAVVGVDSSITVIKSEFAYLMYGRGGFLIDSQRIPCVSRLSDAGIVSRRVLQYALDRELVGLGENVFYPRFGEAIDLQVMMRTLDTMLEMDVLEHVIEKYGDSIDFIFLDGDWLAFRSIHASPKFEDRVRRVVSRARKLGIIIWCIVKDPISRIILPTGSLFSSDAILFERFLPEKARSPLYFERNSKNGFSRVFFYIKLPDYRVLRIEMPFQIWKALEEEQRSWAIEVSIAQIAKNCWRIPYVIDQVNNFVKIRRMEKIGWIIGVKWFFSRKGVKFKLTHRAQEEILSVEVMGRK